ncbi:MAG TPA: peptidoglycan DD-metalloendopeptidase family protein [Burkholderiales bacterium]|nr:peptidoglycan DD-metalloendopeptidase family protein [Burkholderiales bacterium]
MADDTVPPVLQDPLIIFCDNARQLNNKIKRPALENRFLICAGLTVFCLAFNAPVHPAPKEQLQQLRSRIEALQKELANAEESKSEAADALRESELAISGANRKLYELNRKQREVNTQLANLQAKSAQTQSGIRTQQALLEKLLYQLYLGQQPDYLVLLLNGQDPNQISRQLYYYSYISRARTDFIAELRNNLNELDVLTSKTREKSQELKEIQLEQAAEKRLLEKEKITHQQVLASVSKQISQQRREIGTLQRNERRLTRLVEKLAKILYEKKPPAKLSNNQLPDSTLDANPFQQLKGRLNLPIKGELINRFGSPRNDSALTWKGLFILSPSGQDVKAIAAGQVVYADWLRGFGNLIILDHGANYMSLYGNNETLYKQVGDYVHGGETIAAVGNSGGNAESGLYFEMRHEGKAFDPLSWVTVK